MTSNSIVDNIFPATEDIPAEFQIGEYQEQREYLVGGELHQWEGEVNPIASPICLNNNGKIEPAIIGATPLLDGDTAMQALDAAELYRIEGDLFELVDQHNKTKARFRAGP